MLVPAAVGSLALVVLHGAGLFSNSYIEAEERVFLFLGTTAAVGAEAAVALQQPTSEVKATTTASTTNSNSNKGNSPAVALAATTFISLGRHHLPLLLPALCARLAFEATGHGQDVAAHFGTLSTPLPLLALLLGYHYYTNKGSSGSGSSKRTGKGKGHNGVAWLAAAYALILLYWAAQADDGHHAWAHTAPLRLFVPRAVFLGCALAAARRLLLLFPTHPNNNNNDSLGALCLDLAAALSPALLLVLGPAAAPSLLCQAGAFLSLHQPPRNNNNNNNKRQQLTLPEMVALSFLGRCFFFATGHHSQFNRLQYSAAFVGVDDFDFFVGGALLALNTFGTELLALLLSGHYAATAAGAGAAAEEEGEGSAAWTRVASAMGGLLGLSALRTLLTTLCVLLQRRHLMVWAIFAPKFIFDAALHVVLSVGAVGLLGLLAWWRRWRRQGGRGGGGKGGAKKLKL